MNSALLHALTKALEDAYELIDFAYQYERPEKELEQIRAALSLLKQESGE